MDVLQSGAKTNEAFSRVPDPALRLDGRLRKSADSLTAAANPGM
jgi:hypothetical protein